MLSFFRSYQKIIFIIIAVTILASFLLFGTYQVLFTSTTPKTQQSDEDRCALLTRFIKYEQQPSQDVPLGNFLNDDLISTMLLQEPLVTKLLENYLPYFQEDILQKHSYEAAFVPYQDPVNQEISLINIWKMFAPEIPTLLTKVQNACTVSHESFIDRYQLYHAQKKLPSYLVSHCINMQRQQAGSVEPFNQDLSIFGYTNLEDWFGTHFIQACAALILKGAEYARTQGMTISQEEVIADLSLKNSSFFEQVKTQLPPHLQSASTVYQLHLRTLNMSQAQLLIAYQEVLLFKKWLTHLESILLDPMTLESFYNYAQETVVVEKYELPAELNFTSVSELQLFKAYLSLVSPSAKSLLPATQIAQKYPALVTTAYTFQLASYDISKLIPKVDLDTLWNWEESDEGWSILQKKFGLPDSSSRAAVLHALTPTLRHHVDETAALAIIRSHPEWIKEQLQLQPLHPYSCLAHPSFPLHITGITNSAELLSQLPKAPDLYTQNNQIYFRVEQVCSTPHILSFKQALETKLLDPYVEPLSDETVADLELAFQDPRVICLDSLPQSKAVAALFDYLYDIDTKYDLCPLHQEELTLVRSTTDPALFDTLVALNNKEPKLILSNQQAACYRVISHHEGKVPLEKWHAMQQHVTHSYQHSFYEMLIQELGTTWIH